jgi:hypothetical protein
MTLIIVGRHRQNVGLPRAQHPTPPPAAQALLTNRTKRQRAGSSCPGVRPITLAAEHGREIHAFFRQAGRGRAGSCRGRK